MAKYSKKQHAVSPETQVEAIKIAKATQRQGQTKEQTKLIAQGVQKGIELYKKQQKERARDLNRKLKKVSGKLNQLDASTDKEDSMTVIIESKPAYLAWGLLLLSWLGFGIYIFIN